MLGLSNQRFWRWAQESLFQQTLRGILISAKFESHGGKKWEYCIEQNDKVPRFMVIISMSDTFARIYVN